MRESIQLLRRRAALFAKINVASFLPIRRETKTGLYHYYGEMLLLRFQPSPWDGPTILYWANKKPIGHEGYNFEPLLRGPWEEHHCAGGHLTMLGEPYVKSLAEHLQQRMGESQMTKETSYA